MSPILPAPAMVETAQSPMPTNSESNRLTVKELQSPEHALLWFKVNVFAYELHRYREDPEIRDRLDTIIDESFIGMPYFTENEALQLKSTLIDTREINPHYKGPRIEQNHEDEKELIVVMRETLQKKLDQRDKKRRTEGDFRVCAAHDIAPIFEKWFGIKVKSLANNKRFLELRNREGLELKDVEGWGKDFAVKLGKNGKPGRN